MMWSGASIPNRISGKVRVRQYDGITRKCEITWSPKRDRIYLAHTVCLKLVAPSRLPSALDAVAATLYNNILAL